MNAARRRTSIPALAAAVASLAAAAPPALATAQPALGPPGAPASLADIVERVAPAVVSVNVTRPGAAARGPGSPATPGMPFPGFPFPFQFEAPQGRQPPPEARVSGSGFFISASGYVVTNNHVVENATKVSVRTSDGRDLEARVVGRDPLTDLAVLKVEGANFPFVTFETRARPRVGDWVIAMGNPFGLGGTATAGIVSAYGRDIGEAYVDYLQIDASINRGNSGGPTFDVYGRVIGVNSQIFSPSGGSVGIGFAIPAEVADRITRELIAKGAITRGYLGALVQNITPEIAEALGLGGRKGALVSEVTPGGPAERAGLMAGDAILSLNGRPLDSSADLTRQVGRTDQGQRLRLEVVRAGKRQTIDVVSGVRPSDERLAEAAVGADEATLGLSLRPIDPAARRQYGLPPEQAGAVVVRVAPGSDAARKGLRPGDVVERLGERPIATPADAREAVEVARRQGRTSILARVSRQGRTLFLALEVAAPKG